MRIHGIGEECFQLRSDGHLHGIIMGRAEVLALSRELELGSWVHVGTSPLAMPN